MRGSTIYCDNTLRVCRHEYLLCKECMYGQHFQQRRVWINRALLPRLVEQEACFCPLPVYACEMASRDGFDRPVPRSPTHYPHSGSILYSRDSARFPQGVHKYTVNRHWVSPEFIRSRNACRRHSLSIVLRRRASSPQRSSSKGCCLFRKPV